MASCDESDETQMEFATQLDFRNPRTNRRQTSIICTLGEVSRNVETIEQLISAGVNIFRVNCSHDTFKLHKKTIANIYKARSRAERYIGIAVDIKGPEIRTGTNDGDREFELKEDDIFRLSINTDVMMSGTEEAVYVDYPDIINAVTPGTKIYISDGEIVLVVTEVTADCVICKVLQGGSLGSEKSVAIPGVLLDLPEVSAKDHRDLKLAVQYKADFIFASKVRLSSVIKQIRCLLGKRGRRIQIITKIDTVAILQQLNEVIRESDGILIDRSNLGIEIPFEKFFHIQKSIIERCNRAGKPVVVGTQLLESMRHNTYPTCAEIADVTNAVVEGADALMIASESSIGDFPVETVELLHTLCVEAEGAVWHRKLLDDLIVNKNAGLDAVHTIAAQAVESAEKTESACIMVLTTSGRTANLISMYRPQCPVLVVTPCSQTARQSLLRRGLWPILCKEMDTDDFLEDANQRVKYALSYGHQMGIIDVGDSVVIVSPWQEGNVIANNMRMIYAFF